MRDAPGMIAAWAAGGALGAVFFLGLWWTVRKGLASPRPGLWFVGSLALRLAIAGAGLWLFSGGGVGRIVMYALGWAMARPLITRMTLRADLARTTPAEVARAAHP